MSMDDGDADVGPAILAAVLFAVLFCMLIYKLVMESIHA